MAVDSLVDLAESWSIPRWSHGFWGSRYFGVVAGVTMEALVEGTETALWSQYLYYIVPTPPDLVFDQPLDALVQLGNDAWRPWYPNEPHYASLRPRLREKWDFWQGGPREALLAELVAAGMPATLTVPGPGGIDSTVAGAQIHGDFDDSGVVVVSCHAIPPGTFAAAETELHSLSIYVGDLHDVQTELAIYQGGSLGVEANIDDDMIGASMVWSSPLTTGSATERWLELIAPPGITIDPSEVLWVLFRRPFGFSRRVEFDDANSTFQPVLGFRFFATGDIGFNPGDPWPATLPQALGSVANNYYSVRATARSPIATTPATWWSRFWLRFPPGSHPITGPGALQGPSIQGATKQGPEGLTIEFYETLKSIVLRHKPAQWVCWDFIFELGGTEIRLQSHKRFRDPEFVYFS